MTHSHRTVLVVSSLLAGLAPLVGNALYEGPTGKGEALTKDLAAPLPPSAYAGIALELLGFVALTVLLAQLVAMTARTAPVAAGVTAIAGSAMVAVKLGSIAPLMALRLGPDRVDPGVAETLLDLNGAAFVVSGMLLSLALAAAGIGLLRAGGVARSLAWWPATAGTLGVLAGAHGVVDPQHYVPIPFLLLLLWMIALGVATVVRGPDVLPGGATMAEQPLVATQ